MVGGGGLFNLVTVEFDVGDLYFGYTKSFVTLSDASGASKSKL